ncbi:MAG TPA: DUF962 domain-containing protein [Allosphingosinicella sp.]|uniref:DUF962 domain-containing protein n=1 Tax=Allosphingosinicella sp. TaxID=2823234 RepID=UPI002ED79F46
MRTYKSFSDFFPFYLREHAKPGTRALHYAGTTLVVAIALAALVTGKWWLLIVMPVAGYAFAWASHAAIERNRPATFTYPGWSLAADFKMWWLWLTGRIDPALREAGVRPDGTVERPVGE